MASSGRFSQSAISAAADPFQALSSYPAGRTWKRGFDGLVGLFHELRKAEPRPGLLCEIVLKWYQPVFERLYADDYPKRQKDLDQLKTIIASYDDLQSFIDDTTLDPPESDLNAYSNDLDTLVLSTVHSAKGLEWDAVFVIGLADGRFPHSSAFPGEQWEEERRLLYVAATRARDVLVVPAVGLAVLTVLRQGGADLRLWAADPISATWRVMRARRSSGSGTAVTAVSLSLPAARSTRWA